MDLREKSISKKIITLSFKKEMFAAREERMLSLIKTLSFIVGEEMRSSPLNDVVNAITINKSMPKKGGYCRCSQVPERSKRVGYCHLSPKRSREVYHC